MTCAWHPRAYELWNVPRNLNALPHGPRSCWSCCNVGPNDSLHIDWTEDDFVNDEAVAAATDAARTAHRADREMPSSGFLEKMEAAEAEYEAHQPFISAVNAAGGQHVETGGNKADGGLRTRVVDRLRDALQGNKQYMVSDGECAAFFAAVECEEAIFHLSNSRWVGQRMGLMGCCPDLAPILHLVTTHS